MVPLKLTNGTGIDSARIAEHARLRRTLFLASVADRDDDVRTADADADAAAAGSMAATLAAIEAAGRDGR